MTPGIDIVTNPAIFNPALLIAGAMDPSKALLRFMAGQSTPLIVDRFANKWRGFPLNIVAGEYINESGFCEAVIKHNRNLGAAFVGAWAAKPNVKVLAGDFNGDGRTDIDLTGVAGWVSVPVAFSNGDGTWRVTNQKHPDFGAWAAEPNVKVLTGDFNGDGRTDIALTGGAGLASVPMA
jgi:hypothetical protein